MNRSSEKAMRLLQIEKLLWAHPEGLTRAEIARRLQINRSNITKYLDKDHLPPSIYVDDIDGNKLKINREADLTRAAFNLHEILAIHLATRMLATRSDKQNPHAASALRKLGMALGRIDEPISRHLLRSADVMDEQLAFRDPVYLDVLEKLTDAWSAGRKVELTHQMPNGRIFEYIFAPYFIEPYAIGQTAHVIGLRESKASAGKGKPVLRTFKIERLRSARILPDTYRIPPEFDPTALLADAWGIWFGEGEGSAEEVVLRFHPNVVPRVQETRWHGRETHEMQPDGYLQWRATVAGPKEMLPWIRGWGADVEVLAPPWLRDALAHEATRLGEIYGMASKEAIRQEFVAHIRKTDKQPQTLEDHLAEVADYASRFAAKVGLPLTGKALGYLHDFGKATTKFQHYLLSAEEIIAKGDPRWLDARKLKGKIDHATAGAQLAFDHLHTMEAGGILAAQVLALCVASHHSGLIDCLTPDGTDNFTRRMEKPDDQVRKTEALRNMPAMQAFVEEHLTGALAAEIMAKMKGLKEEEIDKRDTKAFKRGLLVRFLLSCLIDADRLSTADFESPERAAQRNHSEYTDWQCLVYRLEAKLDEFARNPEPSDVDRLRKQISDACLAFAARGKGIYQLTVPTGGGKTLASLRYALHHAVAGGIERIVYVAPYTSILDQNAREIRNILEGADEKGHIVLEHHSNLTPEPRSSAQNGSAQDDGPVEEENPLQSLLAENWDAPVVLTTQVQFLEALFGSGTRSVRRMHQLANAVIILDEVQTLPIRMIHMLNVALRFLVHECGATVVLCTATQPPLDKIEAQHRALVLDAESHMIPNEEELFERLRRVDVHDKYKPEGWTVAEIAQLAEQQMEACGSTLVVVNTRKQALDLYNHLKEMNLQDVTLRHMSTRMCAAHRVEIIEELKAKLGPDKPERIICVSTQLIEAGVDIDFGAAIRYLAGLDSIAQTAGRCNRHGKRVKGQVFIVNPQVEKLGSLPDLKIGRDQSESVLKTIGMDPARFDGDRIGIKAMAEYYKELYKVRAGDMKYPAKPSDGFLEGENLFGLLSTNRLATREFNDGDERRPGPHPLCQSFLSAARAFEVIENDSKGVIAPFGEGATLIAELRTTRDFKLQRKLLRRAQRFSVNLTPREFDKMLSEGGIFETQVESGIYYLHHDLYRADTGCETDEMALQQA